jgi:tetratricopeptide (TPR) repeat protein
MRSITNSVLLIIVIVSITFGQNDRIAEAKKFIEQREYELARPILEFLYEEDEENPEVNYWYGVYSLLQNNYDDAIDYFDVAIEGNKNNHRYYYMLGNAYVMKAQNSGMFKAAFAAPKAKSNWEKAVELKPDFLDAKQALFQYYIHAPGIMGGDDEKAKNIADELSKVHPALGHIHLANYYFIAEENPEKAEQELQYTMKVDSTDTLFARIKNENIDLLNNLGYHYLRNEHFQKSKSFFSKAIEISPGQANPYDSMGDYYVALAKYDSALICYENALKKNPKFAASKFNKGKMLEKLNRKQEAITVYKELLRENPESRYADDVEDRLDELE